MVFDFICVKCKVKCQQCCYKGNNVWDPYVWRQNYPTFYNEFETPFMNVFIAGFTLYAF